eukprot:5496399-Prymnesium_polylepis.1
MKAPPTANAAQPRMVAMVDESCFEEGGDHIGLISHSLGLRFQLYAQVVSKTSSQKLDYPSPRTSG